MMMVLRRQRMAVGRDRLSPAFGAPIDAGKRRRGTWTVRLVKDGIGDLLKVAGEFVFGQFGLL